MERSKMITNKIKHTALLSRLSREDDLQGDSESIQTQKAMLEQYASKNGFTNIIHYVDDGYSGTNFDRPDFQRLMNDIKSGKIGVIITKDLSRLGRDHITTGYLLESYFPDNKVRFIAINDDVDSEKGIPDFAPFKNIMNEWYAKDISKKIRSAYRTKALKGEFTGAYAPYGYKKDPNNKHHLIIDEEEAEVVLMIFELASIGKSAFEISQILKKKEILKPRAKLLKMKNKYYKEMWDEHPYDWSPTTIMAMVSNEEYLGHLICNRTYTSSFKSKKQIRNTRDKWIIHENAHEAIVTKELFDKANSLLHKIKKKPKRKERNMFSGLLQCADCGKALSLYSSDKKWDSFCCVTYRSFGKSYCPAHYIRYEVLYDYVLKDIRELINKVVSNEEVLIKELLKRSNNDTKISKDQKEIRKLSKRVEELSLITKRLYEDLVLGKISESLFNELSNSYQVEKEDLINKISKLETNISKQKDTEKKVKEFANIIKKYYNISELNPFILNELIHKIIVHEREIINGKRVQKIEILYKFMV